MLHQKVEIVPRLLIRCTMTKMELYQPSYTFLYENKANIVESDQYTKPTQRAVFSICVVEFDLPGLLNVHIADINESFEKLLRNFQLNGVWSRKSVLKKMAISF